MILIIAEKPSLARNIVSAIGNMKRNDGYYSNESSCNNIASPQGKTCTKNNIAIGGTTNNNGFIYPFFKERRFNMINTFIVEGRLKEISEIKETLNLTVCEEFVVNIKCIVYLDIHLLL